MGNSYFKAGSLATLRFLHPLFYFSVLFKQDLIAGL